MARRGRPPGHTLNKVAVEDLLLIRGESKAALAEACAITTGNLSDLLNSRRGTGSAVLERMADFLRCRPETIAPGMLDRFVANRTSAVPGEAA